MIKKLKKISPYPEISAANSRSLCQQCEGRHSGIFRQAFPSSDAKPSHRRLGNPKPQDLHVCLVYHQIRDHETESFVPGGVEAKVIYSLGSLQPEDDDISVITAKRLAHSQLVFRQAGEPRLEVVTTAPLHGNPCDTQTYGEKLDHPRLDEILYVEVE